MFSYAAGRLWPDIPMSGISHRSTQSEENFAFSLSHARHDTQLGGLPVWGRYNPFPPAPDREQFSCNRRPSHMRYWINTVSRDHVLLGVKGGFTQADHGRNTRLKKIEKGDLLVFYSPRTQFRGGEPLQEFTAVGRVTDDEPFQVEMNPDFHPWRRRVKFLKSQEAPIAPLIPDLGFIKDKRHWGYPFRRGFFEVSRSDFEQIALAMRVRLPKHKPEP